MRTTQEKTTSLGELVTTVYDDAARYSQDPREVSRLATQTIAHMLRHARGPRRPSSPTVALGQ